MAKFAKRAGEKVEKPMQEMKQVEVRSSRRG